MLKSSSHINLISFFLLILFLCVTFIIFATTIIFNVWWIGLIFSLIFIFAVCPPYFFTFYVLNENNITIRCGYYKTIIPFDKIISVRQKDCYKIAPSLDSKRIEVVYFNKKNEIKTTYISPNCFSDFLTKFADNVLNSVKNNEAQVESNKIKTSSKQKISQEKFDNKDVIKQK